MLLISHTPVMAIRGDDHFKFRAKVATRIDVRTERGKYEFKTGS